MFIILWRYLTLFDTFWHFLSRLCGVSQRGQTGLATPELHRGMLGQRWAMCLCIRRRPRGPWRSRGAPARPRGDRGPNRHEEELERIRSRRFGDFLRNSCCSVLVRRVVEQARRASSRPAGAAQAAPDAQTHPPALSQRPPE